MAATKAWAGILPAVLLLAACQSTDGANVFDKPRDFFETQAKKIKTLGGENASEPAISQISKQKTLANILKGSAASVDLSKGFTKSIAAAVLSDPSVIAAADEVDALKARIESVQAQKEIQFSGTIYGGAEDISDKTSGLAAVLNANRVIYDGGKIDSQIEADKQRLMAAQYAFEARLNERALQLASIWIDLDRYGKLSTEIESRLMILNPLIEQLEKITTAGVGDVTQVAAAQRTVAEIRVIQTDVSERLAQTRVSFTNAFGRLPANGSLETGVFENKVPAKISQNMEHSAPLLRAQYASYLAAEADLAAIKARKSFDIGFEAQVSRPFGGSEYDSKESIGLVLRKNFYDGGQLAADEAQAAARVEGALAQIRSIYREGELSVKNAQQTITSMNNAIKLARDNASIATEEIAYLRKQLIIGGSTLDSVLSAEARLYDAESKEINFQADRHKAQLGILSSLGLLSELIGIEIDQA
jgi:outer membrane protein TolC